MDQLEQSREAMATIGVCIFLACMAYLPFGIAWLTVKAHKILNRLNNSIDEVEEVKKYYEK